MKHTHSDSVRPQATGQASGSSRRDFLRGSAAAVGAALATSVVVPAVHAAGNDELKVGLIGCGGRGSGAAVNALHGDQYAKLTAMADMFPDKLEASLANLKSSDVGNRVQVDDEHKFTGWDAYKGVLSTCDVVLLATPPFFRPMHLKAAINAGKHVFCEKPVATDAPGVRDVMETCRLAKEKNLNLVSGLCYRYDQPKIDVIKRIQDGAVGKILNIQSNYLTGGLWSNPRKPDWSDMEYQLRNWIYFYWLAGDIITEQHIHSLDKAMWTLGDVPPTRCYASGGRTVRTQPAFGNVYDHFNTTYEWDNGVKVFSACRQYPPSGDQAKFYGDVSDHVYGTEGIALIQTHRIDGKETWHEKDSPVSMYDAEHVAFFNAIRSGKTINNGDYMCKSTMMALMGRTAAYTGRVITWEDMMKSKQDLSPANLAFGPLPAAPVAVPGEYQFT